MTIAITGATGFVGQALLDVAAASGLDVRALARGAQADRLGTTWISGDLANHTALGTLVAGAEAVIHVAGVVNTPEPAMFESGNVAGTANVLTAMQAAGVRRLVHVSSLSAREPQLSLYGASKARAEALVRESGLDWTIVRPPAIYGPRDRDMFELFRSAKWGVVPVPANGRASLIHVDDLARLLLALALGGDLVSRQCFDPDDGKPGGWSHQELAQAIGAAMDRRVWAPGLPPYLLTWAARGDKLLRGAKARLTFDRVGYLTHPDWAVSEDARVPAELWSPQVPTPDGLRATADWYRSNGWL
ncbi:MAG: NAD(P)-dependent oxidoreductase [Novosphingobium sp.]